MLNRSKDGRLPTRSIDYTLLEYSHSHKSTKGQSEIGVSLVDDANFKDVDGVGPLVHPVAFRDRFMIRRVEFDQSALSDASQSQALDVNKA